MKVRWLRSLGLGVVTSAALIALSWQPATSGYQFQYPRDYFDHPKFQTEWWYYTGNLRAKDGHRFGFELTFFRQAGALPESFLTTATWRPDEYYLAHLALRDIDGNQFFHTERLNRAGPGRAGASQHDSRYWNGNWEVRWLQPLDGHQKLQAVAEQLYLTLDLSPEKPVVVNGQNGISRKGPKPGEASHYLSFTRLKASGPLQWKGTQYQLTGTAWMDHEFFSEPPDNDLIGWDWFAIQLNNNQEMMLYRLRRRGESAEQQNRFSSGTFVDANGTAHFLDSSQFVLTPQEQWRSPESGKQYPVGWHLLVPSLQLDLSERTALKNQELFSHDRIAPNYWEGAVSYAGTMHNQPVNGVGYLEMTGYDGAMHLGNGPVK